MTDEKKYRIVIAEDHTLFRQGLKALLSFEPEFEIVGEAEDGSEAIRCVEELKPDLILLDLNMPRVDGLTAINDIKSRSSNTKVLVLTAHRTEEFVSETLRSGASGYVLKDADHSELLLAMRSILLEKSYLSPDVSRKVIDGYLRRLRSEQSKESLTPRERQILKLIAEGYKSKEIAEFLYIDFKTKSLLVKKGSRACGTNRVHTLGRKG